jgi:CDP-paratose 2-epimerase
LLDQVRALHGSRPAAEFADWRPADQKYYVSNCSRFSALTGWRPSVGVVEGVSRLYHYLCGTEQPAAAVATP